jgi:hypothetical protein
MVIGTGSMIIEEFYNNQFQGRTDGAAGSFVG